MTTNPIADACVPDTGCVVPYEFVRLRYFFGQRLGVLELTDEQAYVVGKQRFHNRHLHGAGVLCGLQGERYAPASQATTTLLKVSRGAAIDGCGREIVVGWDSCIDVAAWVRRHREGNPDLADPQQPSAQRVWVVLCYQECPSDPAPAPRDPCGCETTGCEHSRVREGFRLDLVTESDLPPPLAVAMAPETCPAPPADPCLVLARVDLVLDNGGEVTDLAGVDHDIVARERLWSTSGIQAALATVIDATDLADALAGGPRAGQVAFTGINATDGTLVLPIVLADDGSGGPAPILGDPTPATTLTVRQLLDDGTWQPPLAPTLTWNAVDSQFELAFTGDLAEGRYRLSGLVATDTPIVDAAFRELYPRTFARWFQLELDGSGVLTLSNPSL